MQAKPWLKHYDENVPAHLTYPDIPLYGFLDQAASAYPDQACTIYEDQAIGYAEMEILTDQFAASLVRWGVKKGERVGIILPNIPQFVLAFYGILKAGGIVVAMNPQYKERELAFQLEDSQVKTIVALASLSGLLETIREKIGIESIILTEGEDAFDLVDTTLPEYAPQKPCGSGPGDCWLTTFLSLGRGFPHEFPPVGSQDPAVYQYSGGTTGIPKAAIGLHRNLVANTIQFRNWLSGLEDGEEVVLTAIPLYHVYGMVIAMSVGVSLGASLVLIPNARNVQDILVNIENYRATLFPGVPNLYQAINTHPDVLAGKVNLKSIKACISGSAPLLAETKRQFEALTGGKLMEGYGLSEAPTATHCNPMFGENRTGSIGLPLPDVDCKIVDLEDGKQELPVGQPGELVIRSPQVMAGYHNQPEEEKLTLVDGWLHTGDIARMDGDGYFYLVDRKKEMIKVSGFQVWPREVEEVIALHPKVKEAAVASVPDPERVELVKAWVVLKEGQSLTAEEVRRWCGQYLASYKAPTLVAFREDLPRTTVGKVLRRELRRMHIEGEE
jgi:long-chain acyl-CoA synthetase